MSDSYQAGLYAGLSEAQIRERVRAEDFDPILIRDRAGYQYPPHDHAETKLLAFVQGGMDVTVAGTAIRCRAGDRLLIPGNTLHAAVVHADGCTYFWSEKIV